MIQFLRDHWVMIISIGIPLLIQMLNAATTIWSDHPKAIRWLSFIVSCLSVVRSKGEPHDGPFGALKLPWPEKSAMVLHAPIVPPPPPTSLLMLVGATLLLATGCPKPLNPRVCRHLDGLAGATPWSQQDCLRAQTKRDLLRGFAIAAGSIAAGGAASQIPDTELTRSDGWKLGFGLTTIAMAGAATVLGVLAVSAGQNLDRHCVDLMPARLAPRPPPTAPSPASAPAKTSLLMR